MTDQKLREIFKALFGTIPELNDDTSSKNIASWDSLRHVMLITEVENQFEIKFELDEMLSMSTFGEIREKIESKI